MSELDFFKHYIIKENDDTDYQNTYWEECQEEIVKVSSKMPELPFSNIWMAKTLSPDIPKNSILHFGILNSLRTWNFFETDKSISAYSNVGGFGIDGGISALIGSSLAKPETIHFGFFGDLAFFYDMNVLGNRHVGSNVRIMLINNAKGSEFKLYSHPASRLGNEADVFIAAAHHYGNKSPQLVKHYAEDLGFHYLTASDKAEFESNCKTFLHPDITERPILFEVFTDSEHENEALMLMNGIEKSKENQRKDTIKKLIGAENAHAIKNLIDKIRK